MPMGELPRTVTIFVNSLVLSAVTAKGALLFAIEEKTIDGKRYIAFLEAPLDGRTRPLIVIADNAPFHRSKKVRDFVRSHRHQIRMFFFPTYSPKLNPDEQVWNEIKHRKLQKQPIKNKSDLKKRIDGALNFLKEKTDKVRSFFHLPDTQYAAIPQLP